MRPSRYPGAALAAWLQIVSSHGGISARKLHHVLPWLLRYIALEPIRIYESCKYDRQVEAHRLPEDPIFVLGHWRSGTSFLQELVGLDPAYAVPTLFQCLLPECALSTRSWLPGLIDAVASVVGVRYPIQDRPLATGLPAEEEIAMLCMTDSTCSNWGQMFPTRMRQHALEPAAPAWLEGYRFIVNKLSMAYAGKRLVLKSPMNTARLPLLHAAYPGAVFVHIHRHPLDVFASSRRLWNMIMRQSALQTLAPEAIDELVLDVYETIMRRYLGDREQVETPRLVEVGYANLKADPVAVLEEVYGALSLGQVPADAIARFIGTMPAPSVKPRLLDSALEQRVRSQWEFAFAAWNYQ